MDAQKMDIKEILMDYAGYKSLSFNQKSFYRHGIDMRLKDMRKPVISNNGDLVHMSAIMAGFNDADMELNRI